VRRSRPEALIAVAALVIGCKGSSDAADIEAPARCAARLSDWLEAARAEGRGIEARGGFELLQTARPSRRFEPSPQLWISTAAIELDRVAAGDVDGALAALGARLSGEAKKPGGLLVFADGNTPWHTIARVGAAAVAAKLTPLELVVRGRTAIEPPAAAVPDAPFANCPAAAALAGVGPPVDDARVDRYVAGVGAAIESCGCGDVEIAKAVLWRWLGRDRGEPIASVTVELSATGAPLVLDPETPWSTAVDSVGPLEGPVLFASSPP
jgi:hypothetical protein